MRLFVAEICALWDTEWGEEQSPIPGAPTLAKAMDKHTVEFQERAPGAADSEVVELVSVQVLGKLNRLESRIIHRKQR